MRNLTPTVILNFQGKHRVKETYRIILKNVVDIAQTITEEEEIREAKLLLKQAVAVLETKEHEIWAAKHSSGSWQT